MEGMMLQLLAAFLCGTLLWPLSRAMLGKLLRSTLSTGDRKSRIYGLEHGVLNIGLPSCMWMNVGYWKGQLDDPLDFPQACEALLQTVLQSAFQQPKVHIPTEICLVDVGFGCGDQSLFMLGLNQKQLSSGPNTSWPAVERYVGITNNSTQYSYALHRLKSGGTSLRSSKHVDSNEFERNYDIYCEDAALPRTWSRGLQRSIERLRELSESRTDLPVWLLALDTMYHFKPSRMPLLEYACSELNASFMAFDFMLADDKDAPSTVQRLLLRLICIATSAPYKNLMTQKQYRAMLLDVGYAAENIEIEDISRYVFEPLSEFMTKKDIELRSIGLGIGAFWVAKWIFSWWGRTGVVRGCIIIARQNKGYMAFSELESGDVRGIGIFCSYLSMCVFLTGLIVRDLVKQHILGRQRRLPPGTKILSTSTTAILSFSICAIVSLCFTWYYMLGFFSLSYRTWALQHGVSLPTLPHNIEGVGQSVNSIRWGAWLKDVQLFRDAWEVAMETSSRLLWSQPIFFITMMWAFFIGERVGIQRIRHGWAYMVLGQIVAISFAQSLFYLAVTLYNLADSERHSDEINEEHKEGGGESITAIRYAFWHRILVLFVSVPVVLIPATIHTSRFLWVLTIPHLALIVPPILDPVLIGRMSKVEDMAFVRKESARLYRFCLLCAFIAEARTFATTFSGNSIQQHLHRHSVAYVHPFESASVGTDKDWHGIIASLYDHPAVTSVGWDSMLCFLNYQIWRTF